MLAFWNQFWIVRPQDVIWRWVWGFSWEKLILQYTGKTRVQNACLTWDNQCWNLLNVTASFFWCSLRKTMLASSTYISRRLAKKWSLQKTRNFFQTRLSIYVIAFCVTHHSSQERFELGNSRSSVCFWIRALRTVCALRNKLEKRWPCLVEEWGMKLEKLGLSFLVRERVLDEYACMNAVLSTVSGGVHTVLLWMAAFCGSVAKKLCHFVLWPVSSDFARPKHGKTIYFLTDSPLTSPKQRAMRVLQTSSEQMAWLALGTSSFCHHMTLVNMIRSLKKHATSVSIRSTGARRSWNNQESGGSHISSVNFNESQSICREVDWSAHFSHRVWKKPFHKVHSVTSFNIAMEN